IWTARSSRLRLRLLAGHPVANVFQDLDLALVVPEFLSWEPLQDLEVDAQILLIFMRKSGEVSLEDVLCAGIMLPSVGDSDADSRLFFRFGRFDLRQLLDKLRHLP